MSKDLVLELINSLMILPGVGKKSAQRMALYLLDRNKDGASILANPTNQQLFDPEGLLPEEQVRFSEFYELLKLPLD